jgi:hypothetical protein
VATGSNPVGHTNFPNKTQLQIYGRKKRDRSK